MLFSFVKDNIKSLVSRNVLRHKDTVNWGMKSQNNYVDICGSFDWFCLLLISNLEKINWHIQDLNLLINTFIHLI